MGSLAPDGVFAPYSRMGRLAADDKCLLHPDHRTGGAHNVGKLDLIHSKPPLRQR